MRANGIYEQHSREICTDIAERLRQYLDRTSTRMPPKLVSLLHQLELSEVEAPSIVPNIQDELAFDLALL